MLYLLYQMKKLYCTREFSKMYGILQR